MVSKGRKSKAVDIKIESGNRESKVQEEGELLSTEKTSIQITAETRDRLYRLKFRRTYDQFINELCDIYEREATEK